MAVPFGFSVGDFIATIDLVKDIITALNDTKGAKPAYQRLRAELVTLDEALTKVHGLDVVASQGHQKAALQAVAAQCRDSINRFLLKNSKFQKTLGRASAPSRVSKLRGSLHRLQWALFKEDTIEPLRAEVAGHTTTINLILGLIQAATLKSNTDAVQDCLTGIQSLEVQESKTNALVTKSHDLLIRQADMVGTICQTVTTQATDSRGSSMQGVMQQVLECNMKVYSAVVEMHKAIQEHIPRQVDRQQPVYFEDALGRTYPLHIEFVDSFATLHAVLDIKFRCMPGQAKIQRREYAVRNPVTREILDIRNPKWGSFFRAGVRLSMSMVFDMDNVGIRVFICPACRIREQHGEKCEENDYIRCKPTSKLWHII